MVVDRTNLHYPNLQRCGVVLSGTPSASSPSAGGGNSGPRGGTSSGPVSMPREVLDSLVPLPPPYSFDTEREVLSSKKEEESKMKALIGPNPPSGLGQSAPAPPSYSSTSATSSSGAYGSLTKVERDALDKMKAITNASDAVCTKLLKRCRWKIDEAVNAYYRGDR
mmetsp:Transcript_14194/g.23671  ORF Transcript_14194/g.23671 Transcript_14194/m.23671 type:complete len:166 (-) Transcript_14194:100-597(-)